jgi:hypothetical protein
VLFAGTRGPRVKGFVQAQRWLQDLTPGEIVCFIIQRRLRTQKSRPFFSIPCTPFSPFTDWVTRKSTASEQNA